MWHRLATWACATQSPAVSMVKVRHTFRSTGTSHLYGSPASSKSSTYKNARDPPERFYAPRYLRAERLPTLVTVETAFESNALSLRRGNISCYSRDVIYSSGLRHRSESASGLKACTRVRLCLESPLGCHDAIWMSIDVVARYDILECR
jgi:hypothetical protein